MLSLGWISDLFPKEDYENMIQNLRKKATLAKESFNRSRFQILG
jgi:hypothetical protein